MNYKMVFLLIVIAFGLMVFTQGIVSAENANGSYVTYSIEGMTVPDVDIVYSNNDTFTQNTTLVSSQIDIPYREPYKNGTRISQGQCVEVGGTYDVSGVIGFTTLLDFNAFGYYGRYENAFDPFNNYTATYIYKLPNQRVAYYNFYIDPAVFGNRQGYWYQFTGAFERSANKRAFYVSDRCISPVNDTILLYENKTPVLINPKVIETRHVSDILLSNDDPLYLNMTGQYRVWAFGRTKSIISKDEMFTDTSPILSQKETRLLTPDSYSLLLQNYGDDGRYGVDYVENRRNLSTEKYLVPSLRSQSVADITGVLPREVESTLVSILDGTDDFYTTLKMEVQDPYVTIDGYQEITIGNLSVLEVTGYTNKMPGTPVTLYIDRENQTKQSIKYGSMTIMVDGGDIGDYRTFHGYLPLTYDNMAPGNHQLIALLPSGAMSEVSFYIRKELEPHHEDPLYYKWIDGVPFIPTPTPEIIEKVVVKEVIKEVEKPIYIPVDYNTLATETLLKAIPWVAAGLLIVIPLGYGCLLAIRVYAERRTKKKEAISDEVKE